jgi:hypothetical protein
LITVSQSVLSTNYVQIGVVVLAPSAYNPTADVVQFAFTPSSYPETSPVTWYTGSWVTYPGPQYWAQCLVGPANGGVVLTLGSYQVWLKITDNPEVPVLQDVFLQITP